VDSHFNVDGDRRMKRDLSFERMIAFAQDLIRIPSPPGGEGEVAARVLKEMRSLGFDDVWSDGVGNVFGRVRGRGAGPTVMVNSHLDAVDVGDPGSWEVPPFEGAIRDGFLHGRGAMDIKGPLAIQTYAAAHFLESRPEGDVIVGHTVLEERGGWGMAHLLEAGEVRPDGIILGEATGGDICIGHRGRAEVVIEVQGVAGHASAPERARNPLDALESIFPLLRELAGAQPSDPVLGRASLAPTAVETLPRSKNVIPDRARITVDWRVLPDQGAEAVLREISAIIHSRARIPEGCGIDIRFAVEHQCTYTGMEADRRLFTPGFLLRPDHPIVGAAAAVVRESLGRAPAIRPWTFATDGGHACGVHGIPTIGFAPGEERFAHTNRERLSIDEARAAYATYPRLIAAVQQALREVPETAENR
jgi:putative selenium metabolism hydrolase